MTYEQALTVPQPVKLTIDDFLLLDGSGAFEHHSKTELIDGTIIAVNAQFSEHFTAKSLLFRRLADACDKLGGFEAWVEGAVAMPPHSMPEPDILITTVRPTSGAASLETIALLVEVAHSTVAFDLGEKSGVYAANGVPEYWVVDLPGRRVHQRWDPRPEGYAAEREIPLGERLAAITIGGLEVETAGL